MDDDKKREIEFQIESLKIRIDTEYRKSWFFYIFGVLFTLIMTFPEHVFIFSPIFLGIGLVFISVESFQKERTFKELRNKYLEE